MKRRDFLKNAALLGAALAAGAWPGVTQADPPPGLAGLLIIDTHAHPDMGAFWRDTSASWRYMAVAGLAVGSFAAIGDGRHIGLDRSYPGRSNRAIALEQLRNWREGIIAAGKVALVAKAADIPAPGPEKPGAILGVEGGDALEGKVEAVDEFYRLGVRIITLVHYHNNELGDIMYARSGFDAGLPGGGLSAAGRKIVARMQTLGMVVDVAHAERKTLRDVAAVTDAPLIDSHTGPNYQDQPGGVGRTRSWAEMETVAATGGVVCVFPMAQPGQTIAEWARVLKDMKDRIGAEHIGLGTDGGGSLPRLYGGYRDVRDLGKLVAAMAEAGFSAEEIAAFMGKNLHRVLAKCLG